VRGRRAHKLAFRPLSNKLFRLLLPIILLGNSLKPTKNRLHHEQTNSKQNATSPGRGFCPVAVLQIKGHERLALSCINALFPLEDVAIFIFFFSNYRNHKMATLQANDNATGLTSTSAISPAIYL